MFFSEKATSIQASLLLYQKYALNTDLIRWYIQFQVVKVCKKSIQIYWIKCLRSSIVYLKGWDSLIVWCYVWDNMPVD